VHRTLDDHRLAVNQLWRRVVADIDAAVKTGLADADGHATSEAKAEADKASRLAASNLAFMISLFL
jgi:hypothetical protein